jgi:hypothetical protein
MPLRIIKIFPSHYRTNLKNSYVIATVNAELSSDELWTEMWWSFTLRPLYSGKRRPEHPLTRKCMDFRPLERDGREQITTLVTELHLVFEGEELRENSKEKAVHCVRKRLVYFLIICNRSWVYCTEDKNEIQHTWSYSLLIPDWNSVRVSSRLVSTTTGSHWRTTNRAAWSSGQVPV